MSEHLTIPQQENANKSSQNNNSRLGKGERQLNHESREGQDIRGLQNAVLNPFSALPTDILGLQRILGNRAVGQIIQAKLSVGPAGDRYEQEADHIADQVVNQSSENERGNQGHKAKPVAPSITPLVQRTTPGIQRKKQELEGKRDQNRWLNAKAAQQGLRDPMERRGSRQALFSARMSEEQRVAAGQELGANRQQASGISHAAWQEQEANRKSKAKDAQEEMVRASNHDNDHDKRAAEDTISEAQSSLRSLRRSRDDYYHALARNR